MTVLFLINHYHHRKYVRIRRAILFLRPIHYHLLPFQFVILFVHLVIRLFTEPSEAKSEDAADKSDKASERKVLVRQHASDEYPDGEEDGKATGAGPEVSILKGMI